MTDLITPGHRALTAREFQGVAAVPPEIEWFANLEKADSSLECNFYKVNKRQAAIAAELLERSNKRSTDEALSAAHPRATISDLRVTQSRF